MKTKNENLDKRYLLAWIGGKRLLRPKIAELIPTDIDSYIEPFGGAGWVLFYKYRWASNEIYNDIDGRLVNLFRIVKYHPEEMIKELTFMLHSRELFTQCVKSNEGFTDIQKAARFYFLISRSFGAKGEQLATARDETGSKSHTAMLNRIETIHQRLDRVNIEHLDYQELIEKYDTPRAFFYLDPPYFTGGDIYKVTRHVKDRFDHERLSKVIKNIKGRFILSYDNCPDAKELYKDYRIIEVERLNGINRTETAINKIFKEVLIHNF